MYNRTRVNKSMFSSQLDSFAIESSPSDACRSVRRISNDDDDDSSNSGLVAIVERGGCKFVTKARKAQEAGFAGIVILDNQSHTGFHRITGDGASVRIPAVFLLKPEADRVREMLRAEGVLRVFIQGIITATAVLSVVICTSFMVGYASRFTQILVPSLGLELLPEYPFPRFIPPGLDLHQSSPGDDVPTKSYVRI